MKPDFHPLRALWRVIRGLWLWLGIALAVTFCGLLSLPTLALTGSGRMGHRVFAQGWGRFILWWSGVTLRVEGFDSLEGDQSVVIVANHPSHYGFYAIAAAFPLQWRAVIRHEMRRIPIFGYVAEKAGHVFVRLGDRDRTRADMQAGVDRLREGYWLLVFPEGRPSPPEGPRPFKAGAFRLAIDAGAAVLPVALEETYPDGGTPGWYAAPARLTVRIGKPLGTASLTREDARPLAEQARDEIIARLSDAPSSA